MRVLDRPLPFIVLDDVPMLNGWPVRPVIALEAAIAFRLWDDPAELWDIGHVWDDRHADATCAFTGMEIEFGAPDESGLFPASRCVVQLDNADGRWSTFNADGSLSNFGPGRALDVWAHDRSSDPRLFGEGHFGEELFGGDAADWWLFSGKIARWDQRADDTIEIEAFDAFSDLAQPIGTFTPGVAAEKPSARQLAILNAAGLGSIPHRFDLGNVTLTRQPTDRAPLEEMQIVSQSDAGVLHVDADGTLLSLDRNWPIGRTDQDVIPVVSDNVCSAFVIWDSVITVNDTRLADRVVLENVAALVAATGPAGGYVFTLTEQQWTTQVEGDGVAAALLNMFSPRRLALDEFTLYLFDPHQPDLWRMVDTRRLDQLRFLHEQRAVGGVLTVDVGVLVSAYTHTISVEGGWTMTIATSRAQDFALPIVYDDGSLYDTDELYGY